MLNSARFEFDMELPSSSRPAQSKQQNDGKLHRVRHSSIMLRDSTCDRILSRHVGNPINPNVVLEMPPNNYRFVILRTVRASQQQPNSRIAIYTVQLMSLNKKIYQHFKLHLWWIWRIIDQRQLGGNAVNLHLHLRRCSAARQHGTNAIVIKCNHRMGGDQKTD